MNKKPFLALAIAIFAFASQAPGQSTQHDSSQPGQSQGSAPAEKPKPQKVYRVGGDVTSPRAIRSSHPQLDVQQLKKLNAERNVKRSGIIMLAIVVGEDGTVEDATVVKSFDHDFDATAIEAIKQWKFEPAKKKGVPVAVEVEIEMDFHLYK